jgi:hypothetical protein
MGLFSMFLVARSEASRRTARGNNVQAGAYRL